MSEINWIYGTSEYLLYKDSKTWEEAKSAAKKLGGKLIELETEDENRNLFENVNKYISPEEYDLTIGTDGGGAAYIWLGGSDKNTTSTQNSDIWNWQWDQSSIEISKDRLEWGKGWGGEEPDDSRSSQHRLALGLENWSRSNPGKYGYAGQWNDINSENKLYYVVEIESKINKETNPKNLSIIELNESEISISEGKNDPIKSIKEGIEDIKNKKLYFDGLIFENNVIYTLDTAQGRLAPIDPNIDLLKREIKFELNNNKLVDVIYEVYLENNNIIEKKSRGITAGNLSYDEKGVLDDAELQKKAYSIWTRTIDRESGDDSTQIQFSISESSNPINVSDTKSSQSVTQVMREIDSNKNLLVDFQIPRLSDDMGSMQDFNSYDLSDFFEEDWYLNPIKNSILNNKSIINTEKNELSKMDRKITLFNINYEDLIIDEISFEEDVVYEKGSPQQKISIGFETDIDSLEVISVNTKMEFGDNELISMSSSERILGDKYIEEIIKDVVIGEYQFNQNGELQSAEFKSRAHVEWSSVLDIKTKEEKESQFVIYWLPSEPVKIYAPFTGNSFFINGLGSVASDKNEILNFNIPSSANDVDNINKFNQTEISSNFKDKWYEIPLETSLVNNQIKMSKKTFQKDISEYKFYNRGNGKYEIETPTGIDDITGMSNLTFTNGTSTTDDDKTLNVIKDIKGTFDQITGKEDHTGQMFRLYNAAFARFPDAEGLAYWIDMFGSGANTKRQVANSFLGSIEFAERYGANISDSLYVDTLYTNVLDRLPDAEGKAYWLGQLSSGRETRAEALLGFAESDENKALFSDMTGVF
tara:strand:- start:901 stop:3348 length:2448 start_codon:yes stop_codon:yes gene_type:complete